MRFIHFLARCFYCLVIPRSKGDRLFLALTVMAMFVTQLLFCFIFILLYFSNQKLNYGKSIFMLAWGLPILLIDIGLHKFYSVPERRDIARQFATVRGIRKGIHAIFGAVLLLFTLFFGLILLMGITNKQH